MAAPSSVYKDLKLVDGTTVQTRDTYVAAYLQNSTPTTGSEWGNGYFNASDIPVGNNDRTTANGKIKSIFKLDAIYPVASGSTTTGAGFIGAISCDAAGNLLGSNAFFHSGSRYSGRIYQSGSAARYRLLNDGGLNRKPDASVSTGLTWANYITFNITYESPFYNEIQKYGFKYITPETTELVQNLGTTIGRKTVITKSGVLLRPSPPLKDTAEVPDLYTGPLVEGSTVTIKGFATNEESEAIDEVLDTENITVMDRIRVPFDGWDYWATEPSYSDVGQTSMQNSLYFYEDDFRSLWSLGPYQSGVLPTGNGPIAYKTLNLNYEPVGNRFATPGWYMLGGVKMLSGSTPITPAFYVTGDSGSPGEVLGYKALSPLGNGTDIRIWVNLVLGPRNEVSPGVLEPAYYVPYFFVKILNNKVDSNTYPTIRVRLTPVGDSGFAYGSGFQLYTQTGGVLGNTPVFNSDYSLITNPTTIVVTPSILGSSADIELFHENYNFRRIYPDQGSTWTEGQSLYITPLSSSWVTKVLTSLIKVYGVAPDGFTTTDITSDFYFLSTTGSIEAIP